MDAAGLTVIRLFIVLLLGVVAYLLGRRAIGMGSDRYQWSQQTVFISQAVLRWGLVVLLILLSLHQVGIQVSTIWTAISAVLVLVAIGFVAQWSILSNALCAVFLVVNAPFRIGDEIEVMEPSVLEPAKGGVRGRVAAISLIYTSLEESDEAGADKFIIRMPNNIFFQKAIRVHEGENTHSLRKALFHREYQRASAAPGKIDGE